MGLFYQSVPKRLWGGEYELQALVCLLCRDDSSIFDGLMEEDEKDKAKR